MLAQVPKGHAEVVAAAIRIIFAPPDAGHVREQLDTITGRLGRQLHKVECCEQLPPMSPRSPTSRSRTGRRSGPQIHWNGSKKEIKRRTDVIGGLPQPGRPAPDRYWSKSTTMRVLLVGFSSHRGWDGARRWLATTTPDRAGRGFPIECLSGHRSAAVSLDRGVAAPDA
ncbi:MAG: transposase, Mutator family protein [Propionibacteriaceae bacterium]|nr:transposase, Mutator family protein [Propionibacteriaceae bacterium]